MAEFEVKVDGVQELQDNLEELKTTIQEEFERIITEAAGKIRDDAERRAPKRTGEMAENIIVDTIEIKKTGIKVGVGVEGGQQGDYFYWYFQEFGTANMAANPFLRPAFDENKEDVRKEIQSKVRDLLEEGAA